MNLESLIHAKLEGGISAEDQERLEAILREDWQARRLYLELADLHARLLREPAVATGRIAPVAGRARPVVRRFAIALLAAAAAVVVLLSGIRLLNRPAGPGETVSSGVAMLGETMDAVFSAPVLRAGDTLAPGRLRLESGLAQIEFFSGATLLAEGAAELEVISAWEVRCVSGRIRVRVPPAAKGFLVYSPDLKLEDLGTEFALNVRDGVSDVHVFEGEVIAHTDSDPPANLTDGMSLSQGDGTVTPGAFLPVGDLAEQRRSQAEALFAGWRSWSERLGRDPRVIAYYPMQRLDDDRWDRLVRNAVEPRVPSRAGGAVGARWTAGRWPQKDAIEFKRPGDRVRLNLDGSYSAITLACWVKVDSVDKKYNSLLLTDGYENGEPHWQIYEDGSLMFSIIYRPEEQPVSPQRRGKWNQIYYSRPVFTADRLGRWHHLAVSYDAESGEVIQYFDGAEVGRGISDLHVPGRGIVFGPCEIGNWGLPTDGHQFPVRNLNGAIDEFLIFGAALTPSEIREVHDRGCPKT
jgi:hypothetical protein